MGKASGLEGEAKPKIFYFAAILFKNPGDLKQINYTERENDHPAKRFPDFGITAPDSNMVEAGQELFFDIYSAK